MRRSSLIVFLWLSLGFLIVFAGYTPFNDTGGIFVPVWTVGIEINAQFLERETTSTTAVLSLASISATSATSVTPTSTGLIDPFLEEVGIPASEVISRIWDSLKNMKPDYVELWPFSSALQTFNFSISVKTTESWVIGEIRYEGPATPVSVTTGVSWRDFRTSRGRRIFYESVAGIVWERVAAEKFVSGDFASPFRLTYSPSLDEYPSFDPTGRYLAFISDRIGGNRNIHVWDFLERRIMNFPVYGSSEYFPKFSPDGEKILFQGTMYGQWDLFVMPFAKNYATGIRLITRNLPNAYTPCWYDEKNVLAAVDEGNGADIYSINVYTGEAKNLTRTPGIYEMYPCRVATENSFIFVKLKADGSYGIFENSVSESTETIQPFLDGPFNEFDPYISKSGRFLAYTANSDPHSPTYRVWIKDLVTGEATSVSQSLPYDCYYPAVSPDDRYIVFAAYYPDGEPDLWVVKNPFFTQEAAPP